MYISTIEGEYANSGYETSSNGNGRAYVYYHQQEYLEQKLEENNFEILHLVKKEYEQLSKKSTHMIFIARKI